MLVRSGARRNLPLRLLLSLRPSSSPATCQPLVSSQPTTCTRRTLSTAQQLRPWRRKSFWALAGFERNLATGLEAAQQPHNDMFDAELLGTMPDSSISGPSQQPPWEIRSRDGSQPLIVTDGTKLVTPQRTNSAGIPGHIDELVAIFDACIHVGKLERAEMALRRIQKLEVVVPELLIELHNSYLHELAAGIQSGSVVEHKEAIHTWFELQVRRQGVQHTLETIAILLKASLLAPDEKRKLMLVKRYMGLLDADTALEDLYMTAVLSDAELSAIAELCPSYNMPDSMGHAPPGQAPGAGGGDGDGNTPGWNLTPNVLPVPQKGLGLATLKDTLSVFNEIPAGFDVANLTQSERRELQARLERDSVDAAINRWRHENASLMEMGLNTQLSNPSFGSRLYDWQSSLKARIVEEIALVAESEKATRKGKDDLDRCLYGPFLRQSDPDRTAAVTILSVLSMLTSLGVEKGAPLTNTVAKVASALEEDIRTQAQIKKENGTTRSGRQARPTAEPSFSTVGGKIVVNEAPIAGSQWPINIRTRLGAFVLSAMLETAKITVVREHPVTKETITQLQPAFSHTTRLCRGRKLGVLIPNKAVSDIMTREPRADVLARHLPMLCEPDPWQKFDKGAFVESHSTILRIKLGEKDQEHYTRAAIANGDMEQVMKGLDVLGRTAWNINRPVFDVMLEAWNKGEAIANFPPANPVAAIPPEPDSAEDPMVRRAWLKQVKLAEQERQGLHSVRCFINFQLEIARAFRDQTFYFPHNIDFRGRAYPMPTYLNHMGADHARGLLRFAEGKPLGERGLRWLKIHLSNVFGYGKASLDDREAFAMEHMDDIMDSANNPLDGRKWWLEGEDPWQTLAACFELKAALESPDPTQFVCYLPVHQDGTCNGLQHYAALGGDSWGAKQVNLLPGDKPADIYSAVADLMEKMIVKDIKKGNEIAKKLQGKIVRKVVKQTVMTNVYGVTLTGAKKQVAKQLNALYPELTKVDGPAPYATYIAVNIFKALSQMFHGAHELQQWFMVIGDRICRAVTPEQINALQISGDLVADPKLQRSYERYFQTQFSSTLIWTTPLRMPVVQPYRRTTSKRIDTCLQAMNVIIPGRFDSVHRAKQLQAFPPNFIHSLDASHMLLSALECDARGLAFAAVHDSFWTHPSDIDAMSSVLRDAFIRIHSDNITGRLLEEFKARYRNSLYLENVSRKSTAGKLIRAHRSKHRRTMKDELFDEYKRQQLLRSLDPEAVKRGKEMVTPASIFESVQSADDAIAPVEFEPVEEDDMDGSLETDEGNDSIEDAYRPKPHNHLNPETIERLASGKRPEGDEGTFFAKRVKAAPSGTSSAKFYERVWLPLSFPDVPKKGDLNMEQLRGSKYFFS
ncbi:hypothetical protein B0T16DRAFT_334673 [Cercophora newfieldiana]|uniref:DNA-directed RNA polymerase n=1 Tax=Cercophora newfieldiana TaxID=92897 RepID=A0AA40CKZ7_9PEZI|nr:hypothetical protein B0T16DRAFT_334673 [Cercophora newfieldiana]